MGVALATLAPAPAHTAAHASAPLGQWPSEQRWVAPGPSMPWQSHCQQPHWAAPSQVAPAGVDPGPGPAGPEQADSSATTSRNQVRFTPDKLTHAPADRQRPRRDTVTAPVEGSRCLLSPTSPSISRSRSPPRG